MPGTKPVKAGTISQANMAQCMQEAKSVQPTWAPAIHFDYCHAALSAISQGYSMQQAAQIGNNYIQLKHGNNTVMPATTNPFAGSTFRWQDPGSIWN